MREHDGVSSVERRRWTAGFPLLGYLTGVVFVVYGTRGPDPPHSLLDVATTVLVTVPAVLLGLLIVVARPASPVGPALIVLTAAPVLVMVVEDWGASATTAAPWWGADVVAVVAPGIWVFNFAGFVLLCLTFPDGRLPGRRWAVMPWSFLAVAALVDVVVVLADSHRFAQGGVTGAVFAAVVVLALGSFLAVLAGAVSSLVLRYRRGDELTRLQLRWVSLGAGSVPVLLAAGWLAQAGGASVEVAFTGFMLALLVVLPATVAIAILRHDLLDLDRLLSSSAAWVLTSVVSAGIFALALLGTTELTRQRGGSRLGIAAAAFLTALCLLPLQRRIHQWLERLFDRDHAVSMKAMRQFVHLVRDGQVEPEAIEGVLRGCLDDPDLRVLLTVPGSAGYVNLAGAEYRPGPQERMIPLNATGSEVAVLILGRSSARRIRLAREIAVEARLPIEVSRLRLQLHTALDDARLSRSRLVEAAAVERQRLERDLHDGAQQRILAVGMRLRSVQARHAPDEPTYRELDGAVTALEATVAELRRLAHGIRPSGLDDGLETAIRSLISDCPIPVEVVVSDVEVSEAVATAAYFVIAEGLANTLKHARASTARVTVTGCRKGLAVEVSDDGRGGASTGFALTALRDRVTALGGTVDVVSRAGAGTVIRAEI